MRYNAAERPADAAKRFGHRMRNRLHSIKLRGFKTIHGLDGFEPGPLSVLIGPNGAGKSNFISFFQMMNQTLDDEYGLSLYVAQQGGASKLLHDGPATTTEMRATIELVSQDRTSFHYCFRLGYAARDTLIFTDEHHQHWVWPEDYGQREREEGERESGQRFPRILIHADYGTPASVTWAFLMNIDVHQFHNTSATARMQTMWRVNDNRYLKEDAGNIAPVLLRLKREDGRCYRRIVDTIRLILPFFSDFELEPDKGHLLLAWRERGSDQVFDVSQASDGMLRVISLVTLLLQPEEGLPEVLILDEPELGLHPSAINVIGGLIRAASTKTQVIAATQSAALVDCFEPEDIVVVEREERRSVFRRLDPESLSEWLKEYSLSELWEKNVLGGRP